MTVDEQGRSKGFAFVEFEQEVSLDLLVYVYNGLTSLPPETERCPECAQRK